MSNSHAVQLDPETFAAVHALAVQRQVDVDAVIDAAMQRGLNILRQEQFFQDRMLRAGSVTADEAIAILREMGNDNPPDPGDELPEGWTPLER